MNTHSRNFLAVSNFDLKTSLYNPDFNIILILKSNLKT